MKALLFLLLPLGAFGQCRDTTHWVCFTEVEARAAADSALKGQSGLRRLQIALVGLKAKEHEAMDLRNAMRTDSIADAKTAIALEATQNASDGWQRAYKEQKRKGTRKTITWFILAFIAGMAVNGAM